MIDPFEAGPQRVAIEPASADGFETRDQGFQRRDREGEAMRLDGKYNGQQIVPKAFVDEVRRGGDRQQFSGAGYRMLPGGSYRSMWWVLHNEHGAYSARGIHGQAIYVDPAAEMVIARFGSHPMGANSNLDPMSLPAYDAHARHLMK